MKRSLFVNPLVFGCLIGGGVASANSYDSVSEALENSKGIVVSIAQDDLGLTSPSFTARVHTGETDVFETTDISAAWDESQDLIGDSFRFEQTDLDLLGEATLLSCRTHPTHYRTIHRKKFRNHGHYSRKGKGPGQYPYNPKGPKQGPAYPEKGPGQGPAYPEKGPGQGPAYPEKGPGQGPAYPEKGPGQEASKSPLPPLPDQSPRQYEQKGPSKGKYQRPHTHRRHRTVRHFPGHYQRGSKGQFPKRPLPRQKYQGGKGHYSNYYHCHSSRWHRPWRKMVQHPGKGKGKYQQVRPVYRHGGKDYKYERPTCKNQKQQGTVQCYYPRSI